MSTLKTASVLAFERKLCNSDALLYAGKWESKKDATSWKPIKLQEKAVRGTISNRLKGANASDPLKVDAEIQKANLQTVDIATLPFDTDTLKMVFTLRVLGNIAVPCACNDQEYQSRLKTKLNAYFEEQQCNELALRYAENLANGRFFWRNRIGAEALEVQVSLIEESCVKKTWNFDGKGFSVQKFSGKENSNIVELAKTIQQGLLGNTFVLLKIEAFVRLGVGQEVFPSQELVLDDNNKKNKKSKILYSIDGVAALHSQKIGNAIRTIDTWYPQAEEIGPIAVEPYGSVTNRGKAYRQPKEKNDFYSLLDNWINRDKTPSVDQQHFVIACLIRGGVFGEKD